MLKNYHVDAVDNCGRKVRLDIVDGSNDRYIFRTNHDELYVDRDVLSAVLLQIEKDKQESV